ncbi:MAG: hypothetical protein R2681_04925 [Pyrinomonadaceae bacterium]
MKNVLAALLLSASVFIFPQYAQNALPISEVQGSGNVSPYADIEVTVEGVVTAIGRRGFYIQTPDDKVDDNPATSEGIFVLTPGPPSVEILRGSFVSVKGTVTEYRRENDAYSLFLTEITNPEITVIETEYPLPAPVLLTPASLDPEGARDQLERYEGMRLQIDELMVVSPTGGFFNADEDRIISDGVFYGVLSGTARPFREPGIDAAKAAADGLPDTLSVFDMNPELIRIDSKSLGGAVIDATSGASVSKIVGILDYSSSVYTLLIDRDAETVVADNRTFIPAGPAAENEILIAAFNLENFFDDEENSILAEPEAKLTPANFERRLKKASLAIRNALSLPDVLGVIEVENAAVLEKLADSINSDALAASGIDPKYDVILAEGNDPRGIDVGYLVKASKIKVLNFAQLAKDLKLEHPEALPGEALFSRPPLLAEFEAASDDPEKSFKFTVIVNHFKSYSGIEEKRVQDKKRMQSEFLAKFVSEREAEYPDERLILIGDFNSFQFNDGYNDLIGTLKGTPDKNVLSPTETEYQTGLLSLVELTTPENRYSYIFGGSAQVLDHILVNSRARAASAKFGYARLNADFPKIYANDPDRPERISDHDVPVLYLSAAPSVAASDNNETVESPDDEVRESAPVRSSLFYSLDDKTSDDSEVLIEEWIRAKTRAADENQTGADIFSRSAGGPNGAEWNPSGDLYLMIALQGSENETPEILLNGTAISGLETVKLSSENSGNTFYWLKLPAQLWLDNLRDIVNDDLPQLYGEDWVDKIAAGEIGAVAPVNTGKVIEIEIRSGEGSIRKFFHAAFGE